MSGLHLRAISHSYGDNEVLRGVSVFVAPGELVCLLGPSGCGKTTLLRLAAGLEVLQTGQVEIEGNIVADGAGGPQSPPEKRGVGLMFQDYALFPHMNVAENIGFGLEERGANRSTRINQALASMGVGAYANAYPHMLSGGQQQRVALLRALAPEPKVLLLDEPFSGLDTTRRAHVRTETLRLIKETGIATLMVTHDPEEAMFMADRILVMNDGRVIQDGTPTEHYFEPADAFVTELFGPVNRIHGTFHEGAARTPIGLVPAEGFENGAVVEVLIRPEGVLVSDTRSDKNYPFKVVAARPLGRSSVVILKNDDGLVLEARVPGAFIREPGKAVFVCIDQRQAYTFVDPSTR